jgi:hypothetical protein
MSLECWAASLLSSPVPSRSATETQDADLVKYGLTGKL